MWSLSPIDFSDLPGWEIDDHGQALKAFARQKLKPKDENYRLGSIGIAPNWFDNAIQNATSPEAIGNPRGFFEDQFKIYKLVNAKNERGQVTGFYEPEVRASVEPLGKFQTSLMKRPSDLIAIDNSNRPPNLPSDYRFARRLPSGEIVEYFDRAQIQAGALDDQNLAIAYVEDLVDAFFIHIQGAARLRLQDGTKIGVTFDGKSGQPFTAIGKLLVDRGEIDRSKVSMQTIKSWLADNPTKARSLMEENRSYIFFKIADSVPDNLGPIAAAKVPLSANRSLAVDRLVHTFSTPIFVSADRVNNTAFNHLMIAQETGTAIVGPARGDIFFGSGDEAGEAAGAVNSPCDFHILVPKSAPFDYSKALLR